jgi:hypothetical protein
VKTSAPAHMFAARVESSFVCVHMNTTSAHDHDDDDDADSSCSLPLSVEFILCSPGSSGPEDSQFK